MSRWSRRLGGALAPAFLLPLLIGQPAEATPLQPVIGVVSPASGSTVTGDFTITLSVDLRDETSSDVSVSLGSSYVTKTVTKSECPQACTLDFPMITTGWEEPLHPGTVSPTGSWRGATTGGGGFGIASYTYVSVAAPLWVKGFAAHATPALDGYDPSSPVSDTEITVSVHGDAPTRPADERVEVRLFRAFPWGPDRSETVWSTVAAWDSSSDGPVASWSIPTADLPEATYIYEVRPRSSTGGYGPGRSGQVVVRHAPAVSYTPDGPYPRPSGEPLDVRVAVRGPLAARPGGVEVTLDGAKQTFSGLWPNNGDGYGQASIQWSTSVRVTDYLHLGRHTVSSQLLTAGSSPAPLGPRGEVVVETTPSAPLLDSLTLVSAATRADEWTTLRYSLSNVTRAVQLRALYRNTTTGATHESDATDAYLAGDLRVRPFGAAGPHTLEAVRIIEGDGDITTYTRDGKATDAVGDVWTHSLDLGALDVTVVPGLPREALGRGLPQGAELSWLTSAAERATVSGYRITVNPGGRTITVKPTSSDRQRHSITGLTNGATYSLTLTPLSPWGDGPTFTASVRPMLSTNIFSLGDTNLDRKADVVARHPRADATAKPVYLYPGNGTGGFGSKSVFTSGQARARIHPGGDTDPDRRGDVLVVEPDGQLVVDHGSWRRGIGLGWATMRFMDGGSDFSGDGLTDILAVTSSGALYVYRGRTNDQFSSGQQIGSGWGSMLAFFTPGDWSGDGRADIVAVDPSGVMWLYRGNGAGGLSGSRVKIGVGWGGFGAVVPMRDFDGDGRVDIGAVTMSGDLLLYPGNGRSGFLSARKIGVGWHAFF